MSIEADTNEKRDYPKKRRHPKTKHFYRNYKLYVYYKKHKGQGVSLEEAAKIFNVKSKQHAHQIIGQIENFLKDYEKRPYKYTHIKLDDVVEDN